VALVPLLRTGERRGGASVDRDEPPLRRIDARFEITVRVGNSGDVTRALANVNNDLTPIVC
jgi:hypothetical protein